MPAEAPATYLPDQRQRGVALCLSGGGSRAALFHLGVVIRRLNETGVLSQVNTITSVSGGSIFAAHLAAKVASPGPPPEIRSPNFEALVVPGLRSLRPAQPADGSGGPAPAAAKLAERSGPDRRPRPLVRSVPQRGQARRLCRPRAPPIVFCASDNAYAVNWIFTRERIGDYQAGYTSPGGWTVGKAAGGVSVLPACLRAHEGGGHA